MKRLFSRLTAGLLTATFLFSQNIALAQGLTELTLSESEKISTFKEPEIIEEIISKREECVKHFRKSDLSCVAVLYSEPVHYKDEHGNFQEIDNSLLEENGEFTNTDNLFKVKLSKNSDDKKLVTVTSNGNEISWGYIKKNRKLKKDILPDSEKILDNSTETKTVLDESDIQKTSAKDDKTIVSEKELAKQWSAEIASKYQPETAQIENFKFKTKKFATKKEELTNVSKTASKAKYKNVDPEVDFDYTLSGSGLKENIIINKKLAFDEDDNFNFEFKTNLKIEKDNDGNLNFKNKDGKLILVMKKGLMWDSAEEPAFSNGVDCKFTETDGGYIISVIPDRTWLDSNARVYPLTIDPQLTVPQSEVSHVFAGTDEGTPGAKFFNSPYLPVGNYTYNAGCLYTSLMKYNKLPSFQCGEIITGAKINLKLPTSYTSGASVLGVAANTLAVREITSTWKAEDVTYNNQPTFNPIVCDYVKTDAVNKWYAWDITKLAKKWYTLEDPTTNNGFEFSTLEPNKDSTLRFVSNANTQYLDDKPRLEIQYRNFVGEEPYWSYTTHEAGLKGTGNVNNYAGTLSVSEDILEYSGSRNPLSISNTYNSTNFKGHANTCVQEETFTGGYKHSASTGLGFSLDFNQMLYEIPDESGSKKMYADGFRFLYIDDDGTWHYFKKTDDTETSFVDEDGLNLKITKDGANKLIITDKSDNKLIFENKDVSNAAKRCFVLIFSIDNDGNEIEYEYHTPLDAQSNPIFTDVKVTTIKEKLSKNIVQPEPPAEPIVVDDRITNIIYNESGPSKGLVSKIIMPNDGTGNNRSISFSYDGEKLKEITYPDGLKTGYEYDNQGRISRVWTNEGTGSCVSYQYASNEIKSANFYKVRSVTEYGGQNADLKAAGNITQFDYESNQTKIKHKINNLDVPYHENTEIWQFDDQGRTTCVMDEFGNMISNLYEKATAEPEKNKKNKIKHANDTGKYTNNLLKNFDARHGNETVNNIVKPKNWEIKNWNFDHVQSGNCCGIEVSDAEHHLGINSFKVSNNANHVSWPIAEQKVSIKPARYDRKYTFSGDVKIIGELNGGNGASLHLASFKGETQQDGDNYSTWLHSTDGDWRRISVTINVPAGSDSVKCYFGIKDSEGAAYFDCLQLEESEFANDYNMVENSSFEYDRDGAKGLFSWDVWQVDATKAVENGRVKIEGSPTQSKTIYQDIVINKDNSVLAIRGQAQALSLPTPEADGKPTFRLSCKLSFENGPAEVWRYINFNPSIFEPQSIYGSIDANLVLNEYQKNNNLPIENKKLLKIRIEPNFNHNCNVAYFDNIQVCDDDNGVVYERNEKGSTTAITGSLGNKTTFVRDATSDEVLKIKDYKNNEGDFTYRASPINHQMASSTVPTAGGRVKTEFAHDAHGNVINSVSQAESGQGKTIESTTGYTNSGNYQKSVTDSRGKVTAFNYNENNGNLISSTQNGVTTNYTYDAEGRTISESCNGSQVNYNYSNGVLSSVSHKLSESANIVYNFVRDIFGKVTQTKVGNHVLTTNFYDGGDGLLNQTKFANNQQVDYDHDSAGRVIKKRYYSGKDKQNGAFEYVYNNKGELVQNLDEENNLKTKFEYDKFGRIVDLRRSDDIWSTIKYNALENLVEKITSKIFGINQTVENTFGASNNFENSKITTGNNSIWSKYFYNALGQVESKETLNADETTGLKHNISYVDGSDENRTTNLVESVNIQKKISGSWIPLGKTFSYKYDDVGNISVLEENGTEKVWYYYDENDQLIRENHNLPDSLYEVITYEYDLGGNIQNKKTYETSANFDISELTPVAEKKYQYNNENWKDQLTSYNGQEIIYDGMGNPISYKDGWKFEWVRGKNLDKSLNSCYNIMYKYDDVGIRTKKIVSKKIQNEQTETKTLEFITSGIQILGQQTTTVITDINGNQVGDSTVDKVLWQIDGTGSVLGFEHNGTPYFYVKNTQDDIVGITNISGDIVAEYEYDSWGKLLNTPTGIGEINPLRYRGYYYDGETGLYYLNARYYDPETGRFLNADDCDFLLEDDNDILDYNLYAYCGNNPVNMSDPDGEVAWWVAAALGGAVWEVGFHVADCMINKRPVTWRGVGISVLRGAVTGVAFGAVGKAISGSMSATTRLANYSRRAIQAQRAARTVRRVAPVARKAITYRRFAENSNKIHHLFGRSGHKFAPFLKKFRGNKTKAYNSIYNATFNYAKTNKINGVFEKTLKISGYNVTVRGNVINGLVRISTAFIR